MSIARHVRFAAPVAVWLLALAAGPSNALAQTSEKASTKADRAAARDAYDKGTASFQQADYVTALDSFVKANALIPSVQALYWIAQSQDKLGRTEAAVEAYEAITARADFNKLSEDKAAIVRARLASLKTPPAPPPEPPPAPPPTDAPPAEAPPPVDPAPFVPPPPPPPSEPPPPPASDDLLPKKNTAELGVMGGLLIVTSKNNFKAGGKDLAEFDPAYQVGIRAAFFPVKVFGIEAEYAHGFSRYDYTPKCAPNALCVGPSDGSASFDSVRGHLIGQLPTSRFIPFALLGGGMIREKSEATGRDRDFAFVAGVGAKVMATKLLVPRFDVRLNLTQKRGPLGDDRKITDGITVHPEFLLGLSFRLPN
ncbi:MAG TPA: hypothetical protein VHP33_34795 [Polyangiaceae bacterium]|nr:hypothetical protein [Polyangiaceae bacterium]